MDRSVIKILKHYAPMAFALGASLLLMIAIDLALGALAHADIISCSEKSQSTVEERDCLREQAQDEIRDLQKIFAKWRKFNLTAKSLKSVDATQVAWQSWMKANCFSEKLDAVGSSIADAYEEKCRARMAEARKNNLLADLQNLKKPRTCEAPSGAFVEDSRLQSLQEKINHSLADLADLVKNLPGGSDPNIKQNLLGSFSKSQAAAVVYEAQECMVRYGLTCTKDKSADRGDQWRRNCEMHVRYERYLSLKNRLRGHFPED